MPRAALADHPVACVEYACPEAQRWFVMRPTRFRCDGAVRVLVAHFEMTLRKQAEDLLRRMHDAQEALVALRAAELEQANRQLKQEIEERNRVEAALRDSELRFRQLADCAPVFVWTSLADGSVTYLNQNWYDYTGLTREQPIYCASNLITDTYSVDS